MKTCEDCGKTDETVRERDCVYAEEIHGILSSETVCNDCEWQHAQDI